MGILDKLAFWRKEPELPNLEGIGRDSGFGGPGGFGDSGIGNPNRAGDQGFNQLGLGNGELGDIEPGMPEIEPGYNGGPGQANNQYDFQRRQQQRQPQFQQPFQQQQQYAPIQPSAQQFQQTEVTLSKDFEVISSKLDTLRVSIEAINNRLANLERMAYDSQRKKW